MYHPATNATRVDYATFLLVECIHHACKRYQHWELKKKTNLQSRMCRCSMEGHWWHLLYLLVFHAGISSNRLRASNCEVSAVVVREWLTVSQTCRTQEGGTVGFPCIPPPPPPGRRRHLALPPVARWVIFGPNLKEVCMDSSGFLGLKKMDKSSACLWAGWWVGPSV